MVSSKVYFISGGSRGIGFNLVKLLSERTDTVVIASARLPEKAQELSELSKKNPNVHIVKLDVSSKKSTLEAAASVSKITDKIDVLISNAGISDAYSSVLEAEEEKWLSHYRTNVLGSIFLYQALYPFVAKSKEKQIVFVSSAVGSIGNFLDFSVSAYGQSKAALNYTTKEISSELKDEGFTVIAVHPGLVHTDMFNIAGPALTASNPELLESLKNIMITPETSASSLLGVFDKLKQEDNGKFINYDGSDLQW